MGTGRRMNNYEKIKSMSVDEMAELLQDRTCCDTCVCNLDDNKCMTVGCNDGIQQWLLAESEIDRVQFSDEVSDFIQSLIDNPQVPEDIQDKAGELWQKI